MRLYELHKKINELRIRQKAVGNKKPTITSEDKLLSYSFGNIYFYKCSRPHYLYYIATDDHKSTIGALELNNHIDKLYDFNLQEVSTVLIDTKYQGKQIGQHLYYAALEDGIHILSGDTQTPMGAKNLEKIVNSKKYDSIYYNDETGDITEDQPANFFVHGNDTPWRLILAK